MAGRQGAWDGDGMEVQTDQALGHVSSSEREAEHEVPSPLSRWFWVVGGCFPFSPRLQPNTGRLKRHVLCQVLLVRIQHPWSGQVTNAQTPSHFHSNSRWHCSAYLSPASTHSHLQAGAQFPEGAWRGPGVLSTRGPWSRVWVALHEATGGQTLTNKAVWCDCAGALTVTAGGRWEALHQGKGALICHHKEGAYIGGNSKCHGGFLDRLLLSNSEVQACPSLELPPPCLQRPHTSPSLAQNTASNPGCFSTEPVIVALLGGGVGCHMCALCEDSVFY